jgi:pyrroline-5-carboxylate reductase
VSDGLLERGQTLGVVGAGVMGQTLMKGVIAAGLMPGSLVWSASKKTSVEEYRELIAEAGVILVCVKPGQIQAVTTILREAGVKPNTLLVSILGGITTQRLESLLGLPNVWLRAMPNTPCMVGKGMTVVCGGRGASAEQIGLVQRIFSSMGSCLPVEEQYFNAVTALSGSGPAYMYLVVEALADAGVRVGLRRDLALHLATQTMLGSAHMVLETGRHPASLRDDVTTPAGTTIGALLMLEDGRIRSVLAKAVEEATKIAEERGRAAAKT